MLNKDNTGIDSKELIALAKSTFKTDKPNAAELKYVMTTLVPSLYLLAHHTVGNHPLTFSIPNRDSSRARAHRPWQVAIINDLGKDVVVQKSRQLGMSEMFASQAIWFADRYSEFAPKVLYTFPTNRNLNTFVKTRFNPVLERGYYATIIDDRKSSIQEKRIRNSFLIFRSSSKASAVEGVDVDSVYLDEYDRVPYESEASAKQSMSSSNMKRMRRFSTPSTPGHGINRLFTRSDMKYYVHKCDSCGYDNYMKYADFDPDNLEESGNIRMVNPKGFNPQNNEVQDGTFDFVCQKCGEHLDRWYNGRWVAKYPERKEISGYKVTQLNAVWISADQLKRDEYASESLQSFYNYSLGETYQDLSVMVTEEDIINSLNPDQPFPVYDRASYTKVGVGIDWGTHENNIVVMAINPYNDVELIRQFSIPVENSYKNIDADINKTIVEIAPYEPDLILADLGFNGTKVNRLIREFGKDKVFGVNVKPVRGSAGEVNPEYSLSANRVSINKIAGNLFTISQLKSGTLKIAGREEDEEIQKLIVHWKNVVIRDVLSDDDTNFEKEQTRTGPDHRAQAQVYATYAIRRLLDIDEHKRTFGYSDISMSSISY